MKNTLPNQDKTLTTTDQLLQALMSKGEGDPNPDIVVSGNGSDSVDEETLIRMMSFLHDATISRAGLIGRAGQTFNGERNVSEALGRPKEPNFETYLLQYLRGGIAKRIVTTFPNETWVDGISIEEDEDPKVETALEKAFEQLKLRTDLSFISEIRKADILSTIGHYSVILIGTTNSDFKDPLPVFTSPKNLIYLSVFNEDQAQVDGVVGDGQASVATQLEERKDPRFGLPRKYRIKVANTPSQEVHHSRVIHVAHELILSPYIGQPFLEAPLNDLLDLAKMTGAIAEAVWQGATGGKQFDIDATKEVNPQELEKWKELLEKFRHGQVRDLLTRNTKVSSLSNPVPQGSANVQMAIDIIAATVDIPKRRLMGQELGDRASTEDRNKWQDTKDQYVSSFAAPLIGVIVDKFIRHGFLPKVRDPKDKYRVVWPLTAKLTVKESAEVTAILAQANKDQVEAEGKVITTSGEIRFDVLNKEVLSAEESQGIQPVVPDNGDGEGEVHLEEEENNE